MGCLASAELFSSFCTALGEMRLKILVFDLCERRDLLSGLIRVPCIIGGRCVCFCLGGAKSARVLLRKKRDTKRVACHNIFLLCIQRYQCAFLFIIV